MDPKEFLGNIFPTAFFCNLNSTFSLIFNKTYKEIFSEFEGKKYEDEFIAGDVK